MWLLKKLVHKNQQISYITYICIMHKKNCDYLKRQHIYKIIEINKMF